MAAKDQNSWLLAHCSDCKQRTGDAKGTLEAARGRVSEKSIAKAQRRLEAGSRMQMQVTPGARFSQDFALNSKMIKVEQIGMLQGGNKKLCECAEQLRRGCLPACPSAASFSIPPF